MSTITSMTGFGAAEANIGSTVVSVVMRSLNHRHLDLRLRLPELLRETEEQWASLIRGRLQRGRVEVTVRLEDQGLDREIVVDRELVRSVVNEFGALEEQGLVTEGLSSGDLLRWPSALSIERPQTDSEALRTTVQQCLEQALAALIEAREHEGDRLQDFLEGRLIRAESLVHDLCQRRTEVEAGMRQDYRERLRDLGAAEILSEERIALEVAAAIDKSSISEETDRLVAHCGHFRATMADRKATGRKLDFIVQEIFREFNTIAAKCRDSESVHAAIEGKTLCEDLREQIRNVE